MAEAAHTIGSFASSATDAASNASKLAAGALHPYYPLDAEIANYVANTWSVPALLGVFFSACGVLFASTYFVARSVQPRLTRGELLTIMWFVLSGAIHLLFEGYYARNYATMGGSQHLMGQMWKEYAYSDSRYLTNNSFVLCMETVTAAFWGPGCMITAAMIVLRHPLRYSVQLIVSLGQFYGVVLYYATCEFDNAVNGVVISRPEPFYYWFYYFTMNFFWFVIPGCKSKSTQLCVCFGVKR